MEVEEKVDSDHHPIVAWIRGRVRKEGRNEGINRVAKRGIWNEEGIERFKKKIGRFEGMEEGVQDEIGRVTEKIRKTIEECEEGKRKERGSKKGWWDEECKEKKKDVKRELRNWRKRGGDGDRYRKRKREYKKICERKKKEEKEKMIREVGEAKTMGNW